MNEQKQQLQWQIWNISNTVCNKLNSSRAMLLILVMLLIFSNTTKAQDISCSELVTYVKSKAYPTSQSCFGSSFLVKVDRYEVDGNGLVIAWIKKNEYDFTGNPYIYCGISYSTWSNFTSAGITDSWGKAFHQYIKGNNCNCN